MATATPTTLLARPTAILPAANEFAWRPTQVSFFPYFSNLSNSACYSSCPCFENCPNGCDGCANSICTCNEPQKDNSFYIQCMDQATDDFKTCIMSSTNDKASYDLCYDQFTMASEKCPCNSGCETGCPCEDGFKCQENIMAMCQMYGSSGGVNFTYVISADGNFQDTITLLQFFFWKKN